jgi:hypothetical protein
MMQHQQYQNVLHAAQSHPAQRVTASNAQATNNIPSSTLLSGEQ